VLRQAVGNFCWLLLDDMNDRHHTQNTVLNLMNAFAHQVPTTLSTSTSSFSFLACTTRVCSAIHRQQPPQTAVLY